MAQSVVVVNIRVPRKRAFEHIKDLTFFLVLNGSMFQVLSTAHSHGEKTSGMWVLDDDKGVDLCKFNHN